MGQPDPPLSPVCEHLGIEAVREMPAGEGAEDRVETLLADAREFFEAYLWGAESAGPGRDALAKHGLTEDTIREFGVGYAPVGPDELMSSMRALGYTTEELGAAGLVSLSARGRAHAHFRSRVMFPVRDAAGRILGFAGLGTHVGPSWALWITSPDVGLYNRSRAVYGLDRAAEEIAKSGTAVLRRDCIEVLHAHQDGQTNAVAIHSSELTGLQLEALAADVEGGVEGLTLDLPPGMEVEEEPEPEAPERAPHPVVERREPPPHAGTKRTALVIATALLAINAWTGAPLLAIWVGSQAQSGHVLSTRGVLTVLVVLSVLVFFIGWALTWLSARYDELAGRPRVATETSPWQRAKRGDRVQDIRARFGISAPEKVVAASVIAGVLIFEIWFFFLAGSSLPHP